MLMFSLQDFWPWSKMMLDMFLKWWEEIWECHSSFPSGLAELDLRTNATVSWRWLMVLRLSKIASLAALELCEMIASCGGGCFMGIKWRAKCAEVQGINTWIPPVHDDCLTVGLDDWWFLSLKTLDALHVEVYFWFPLWPEASWLSVNLGMCCAEWRRP